MTRTRKLPEVRRREIIATALALAVEDHYLLVTRARISDRLGISGPAITHHFGDMLRLREAVMREAIRIGSYRVLAQGLGAGSTVAWSAPAELREEAAEALK